MDKITPLLKPLAHTLIYHHSSGHTPHSFSQHSLAPPQRGLHALSSVPLVVINERKGQGDVEGVGPARRRRPLPRLKCDGEVHPGCRTLGFEALDEVLAKDLTQHGFEGQIYTYGPVRTT